MPRTAPTVRIIAVFFDPSGGNQEVKSTAVKNEDHFGELLRKFHRKEQEDDLRGGFLHLFTYDVLDARAHQIITRARFLTFREYQALYLQRRARELREQELRQSRLTSATVQVA